MKKIVEVPKKIKPNENNNNKKGKERVSTPKGKSKLRIKDKPDKLDFNKTIVVKNDKRSVKSVDAKKSVKKNELIKKRR